MDKKKHGIFATRAPYRPNPIGISVVKLLCIRGNLLYVSDLDVLDGTSLLDIKLYVPQFDSRKTERIGWLSNKIHKLRCCIKKEKFS